MKTAARGIGLAAALFVALVAPSDRAQGAMRLTLTYDPGGGSQIKQYFYSSSDNGLAAFFSIGQYTGSLVTAVSNYPGLAGLGTLSQTVNVLSISGAPNPARNLTSYVEIITNAGLADGQVTGGNIATLLAQTEKYFAAPDTDPLRVTSDVGASHNPSNTSGTMQTDTIVNGVSLLSSLIAINAAVDGLTTADIGNPPPPGYTLSQRLFINGMNIGSSSIPITGSSSVRPVPAPGALALCASGFPMLVAGWFRRRRS